MEIIEENLVSIRALNLVGQDARGVTMDFQLLRQQSEFIYITRKAGSVSGNTFHTGKFSTTNPKIFILLSGTVSLAYRKIGYVEKFKKEFGAPAIIEIMPFVTHKIEALEDIIILECNSIKDIQNDRTKEEV